MPDSCQFRERAVSDQRDDSDRCYLPTNNLVPVVVSVGTATSQPGVTMAVVATGGH